MLAFFWQLCPISTSVSLAHVVAFTVLCKSNASEMRAFLCPRELSKKVCEKVQVTMRGLLSEISPKQRTLFHGFINSVPEILLQTDTTILHTIYFDLPIV